MKKYIQQFDWTEYFKGEKIVSIDNDLILLEKPIIKSMFQYPYKTNMTTALICLSGKTESHINLKSYNSTESSLTITMPNQILQQRQMSEDFRGLFIVMSTRFVNSLNIQLGTLLYMTINENPVVQLTGRELNSITSFYFMLKEAIQNIENPYRMETVRSLTKAFFYGSAYSFHKIPENYNLSKHEILVAKYLSLVKEHYKQERAVSFYAKRMCLTPKYLSTLVKENSNQSANDWINRYVVLEAQALLKSTNMTIQQISDELNFPSQSFFGKYFKRITKISPREYRKLP